MAAGAIAHASSTRVEVDLHTGGSRLIDHHQEGLAKHYDDRVRPVLDGSAPPNWAKFERCKRSTMTLADPSVPVFWILPKGLITTIFPPFSSPPEAFTAGHKALNYVASAALMVVICLTT